MSNKRGIICGAVIAGTGLMLQSVVATAATPGAGATVPVTSPGIANELAGKQYAWRRCWRAKRCVRTYRKCRKGRCWRQCVWRWRTVCRGGWGPYWRGGYRPWGWGGYGYWGRPGIYVRF